MGDETLLITGASGRVGRRTLELLAGRYPGPLIAATRNPQRLAAGLPATAAGQVTFRHADFDDPATLASAFQGVERMLLVSTDAMAVPGQRWTQQRNAVQAAQAGGVRHVVYTSLSSAREAGLLILADHGKTEALLESSGLGHTLLRVNVYTDMLLLTLPAALRQGELVTAAGTGRTGYISREDCALAIATLLCQPLQENRQLDLTGAEALSMDDVAEQAARVTGRPLRHRAVSPAELEAVLLQAGAPDWRAAIVSNMDGGRAQGWFDRVTPLAQSLLGRAPASVERFFLAHRKELLAG